MSKVLNNKSLGLYVVGILSSVCIISVVGHILIYLLFDIINLRMITVTYISLFLGCILKLISFFY